jgi:hypothetical protein
MRCEEEKGRMKRTYLLTAALLVLVFVSVSAVGAQQLVITKTALPDTVYVYGSKTPDQTTVTISVTGYGGTSTSTMPMDIVFDIDGTGSMETSDPSDIRLSGAKDLINQLDDTRDQVGVIGWNTGIVVQQALTQNFDTAKTAIDGIDSNGATNGELALHTANLMLDANTRVGESTKAIIFLTDGIFNQGNVDPVAEMNYAAGKGYKIYSVGLGGDVNPTVLQEMATITGGKYYFAATAGEIEAIYNDILKEITINTAPSNVNVVEVTQDYIVDEGSCSPTPCSIVDNLDGTTTITWLNVGQHVGNFDEKLDSTETFEGTFTAGSDTAGLDLPVDVAGSAVVNSIDPDSNPQTDDIPQALLDVIDPSITIEKSATPPSIQVGDPVTYSYLVTNTGNCELTGITLTDSVLGPITCPDTTLAPLAFMTCTKEAYPDNDVINTADVTGYDPLGNPVTDSVETAVEVKVNHPPVTGGATPSLGCLWPPNHQFVDVTINGVTDPDPGNQVTITVTKVTSDEDPSLALGAGGDKAPDAMGVGTPTASLRVERAGTPKQPGNGRVYVIEFSASDNAGGVSTGSVQVCVPHDQSGKCKLTGTCWCPEAKCCCIDDGQQYVVAP